jgi:hypothetical protein
MTVTGMPTREPFTRAILESGGLFIVVPWRLLSPRTLIKVTLRMVGPFGRAMLGRPGPSLRLLLVRLWHTDVVARFLSAELGADRAGRLYDPDRRHGGLLHLREVLRGQCIADPIAYLRKVVAQADPDRAGAAMHDVTLVGDMDGFSR